LAGADSGVGTGAGDAGEGEVGGLGVDEGGELDPGDLLGVGLFGFGADLLTFGFGQPFFRLPCTLRQ
jgi:hypothetical protein